MPCATNLSALKSTEIKQCEGCYTGPAKDDNTALSLFPVRMASHVQVTVNVDPVSVSNFVI